MNERQSLAWLGRKIAWGFSPGMLDDWTRLGVETVIDHLVDPDRLNIEHRPDPFDDIVVEQGQFARAIGEGIAAWTMAATRSPRPLETFMDFFWADFFAVSIRQVRPPNVMFDHMSLLARHGLGNFATLLHAVTIDAAMLFFLDGAQSAAGNPNENYARELLELYTVGVGNFSESDVQAAATALTGWVARPRDPVPRLVSSRHDDTPRTLLGVDGVHDVETVVAAVVRQQATHQRVVDALGDAILGPGHDRTVTRPVVERFADDLEIRPVVRSLLELAVAGAAVPSILEPVPWLVAAFRFAGAVPERGLLRDFLRGSSQIPLAPPNVGGYPAPEAYLSTSATIARFNTGSILASRAGPSARDASRDTDRLAEALGLVDGFSTPTHDAIESLQPGPDRIAAALASPDLLVV